METKKTNQRSKPVFGTKEWACQNENCLFGCSNGCKYCYALENHARFKRKMPVNRMQERLRPNALTQKFGKLDQRIMFPTVHDIPPGFLNECMIFLEHMLLPGNEVLIVTKPRLDCINAICERFIPFKDKILFRFTIGSTDSDTLNFWEPNAPDFQERMASLQYAFQQGYQTSVSCEPMLDGKVEEIIKETEPFITDAIWLGKMNKLSYRLRLNGEDDPITIDKAEELIRLQSKGFIPGLYRRYKDNPKVKWKDSIKKVVGLEVATEPGLDK
jgi:DNA repair photolyase